MLPVEAALTLGGPGPTCAAVADDAGADQWLRAHRGRISRHGCSRRLCLLLTLPPDQGRSRSLAGPEVTSPAGRGANKPDRGALPVSVRPTSCSVSILDQLPVLQGSIPCPSGTHFWSMLDSLPEHL